jgi:transcriptional regulator with XRE-family HTH domain
VTRESAHVTAQRAELGKRLAEHRERNGLNKTELAERLFYDRTSISKLEAGQQSAPREFWCGADGVLGAGGELVAGFDALADAKASDALHDALTAATLRVAQARARIPSVPANPDQVDAVIELEELSRALTEHNRRVLMGERTDWAEIAKRLNQAATICRSRVIADPCTAGDRGRS